MKKWIKRIAIVIIGGWFAYLVLINAALNLHYTQTFINGIKPEKFQVHWDKAWSPYPFRLYVENVSANGKSSSQEWHADVKKASASIALMPLLMHKVNVYNVDAEDAAYRQLSKKRQKKDHSSAAASTKTSKTSDSGKRAALEMKTDSAVAKKEKKAWQISIEDISASGHHSFAINDIKGDLDGDLEADVSIETKGGPFSLDNGKVDIAIRNLELGEGQTILKNGKIEGDIEISPLLFQENKGVKILKFVTLNSDIEAETSSLDFLDLYLHGVKGMKLDGKGLLKGHLNFDKGMLLKGTKLHVDAKELSVALLDHEVDGEGEIKMEVASSLLDVEILFNDLRAYYIEGREGEKDHSPLFVGKGLKVAVQGEPSLLPKSTNLDKIKHLAIELPSVEVKDLAQYQRYIPDTLKYKLYGGEGILKAKADISESGIESKLSLHSIGAHIGIDEQHLQSDLDLFLHFGMSIEQNLSIDISGSHLSLDHSKIFNQDETDNNSTAAWDTGLKIDKGTLLLPLSIVSSQDKNATHGDSKKVDIHDFIKWVKNLGVAPERKKELLRYLTLDSDLKLHMGSFEFLNPYLKAMKGMELSGEGVLKGKIVLDKGKLLQPTALKINANTLSLSMMGNSIEGSGQIDLNMTEEIPDTMAVKVAFDHVNGYVEESAGGKKKKSLLFNGKLLYFDATLSSVIPSKSKVPTIKTAILDLPSVHIDDLSRFQQFIPEKWRLGLYRGTGEMRVHMNFRDQHMDASLKVLSDNAEIGLGKQHFESGLDLLIKMNIASVETLQADLSGSYLSLNNSRISNRKGSSGKRSKIWDSRIAVAEGKMTLHLPERPVQKGISIVKMDDKKRLELKEILAEADSDLKIVGEVSQLEWINYLLRNSLALSFAGSGKIEGDLHYRKGWITKGSTIKVKPKNLQLSLLDYVFMGNGDFLIEVIKGGEKADIKFDLELKDARIKRSKEKEAMIEKVALSLGGVGRSVTLDGPEKGVELRLEIPSAKMKRVSVYNQFLPKNSPFSFMAGSADLKADIKLKPGSAKGYVDFVTSGLTMKVVDQKVSARLRANIKLAGGEPKKMKFDISGSTITLDQARVVGRKAQYSNKDWSAIVKVKKAEVIWRKPIWLRSETQLTIKDSRPIVAMIDNKRDKHGLISKLLTIENIHGIAQIDMANNTITVPNAYVKSDKIDIGAKGIISPKLREGMYFFRYRKLKGLLKMRNGKKNFDIFKVQKTFDSYTPPHLKR